MARIPKTFGEGGAHLIPGASGDPSLPQILRDIAADLATLNGTGGGGTPITAPALGAFSDPPTAIQMEALRTLVNQIRARLAGGAGGSGGTLLTTVQT